VPTSEEQLRVVHGLNEKIPPWRRWGAYVSERTWGTVREDYSPNGDAWNFTTHEMARSKAYRWGEDGLCGWCDLHQALICSFAFWNGHDPFLKERLFGLNPNEGNHGEDVKEVYFYLDATPTHSYMKYIYRYPQAAFPYKQLVDENRKRTPHDREYEIYDTGVFAENRFFDIVIEYAKESPNDTCMRVEIFNRSEQAAPITVLPQICFRNRWAWEKDQPCGAEISVGEATSEAMSLYVDPKDLPPPEWLSYDYRLEPYYFFGAPAKELLFTNNDTNNEKLYGPQAKNRTPFVKDAFHRYVVNKEAAVNPAKKGTKACFHYPELLIPAKGSKVLYFRLTPVKLEKPLQDIQRIVDKRKKEADGFYASLHPQSLTEDEKAIQRQALAGLMWSTQFYFYDVKKWLQGDDPQAPPPQARYFGRNAHWKHLHAYDLLIMPDKWEYPWFASWDCAFHCLAISAVDLPFAKNQMKHFFKYQYQHPKGQIPAYEWGFSDVNPPVQAWTVWQLYAREKMQTGKGDVEFLEYCYLKLLHNFDWWVNKVDFAGNDVFEGGFLGLDNISIIDRSRPLPSGGYFEQSDGTGWMGFFTLMMFRLTLELAKFDPVYQKTAMVFLQHFVMIAKAIEGAGHRSQDLWDAEDGFFYDVISHPSGAQEKLKVRSFVGLIPFFSIDYADDEDLKQFEHFYDNFQLFLTHHRSLLGRCISEIDVGGKKRYIFSLMTLDQMRRVLQKAFDPNEFLSPYGLRSLSKFHEANPVNFHGFTVAYEPGESLEKIKGGNSNWRGPIWLPTNYLFLKSLERLSHAVDGKFQVPYAYDAIPIAQAIQLLRQRLTALFQKNKEGQRPIFSDTALFSSDPLWKDSILFFEHYHGDTGRGLGASHQTGWSALVANLFT